jgi:putative PIN family toxin of toxin-antitoxin system
MEASMKQNIIYISLDVDDTQYHGATFNKAINRMQTEEDRVVEKVSVIRNIDVCPDPQDNKFLELAVDGRAGYIITGDQDLLTLHSFNSIEIITPQDYLADD